MGRFRQAMYRFMYGRYGSDELGTLIFWVYFALLILNLLLRSLVLYILLLALLSLYLFRCFSRNHERRRRENRVYLSIRERITGFFRLQIRKFKERKTHVYRRCPNCKAIARLPRRKGRHVVCCPKCGNDFNVKV